ncbi:17042_t:CDS:2, partial [Racocetra fulgida]
MSWDQVDSALIVQSFNNDYVFESLEESNNSETVHNLTQDTGSNNEDDESVCDLTQDIDSDINTNEINQVQSTLDEFNCGDEVVNIQESEKEENNTYYEDKSINRVFK